MAPRALHRVVRALSGWYPYRTPAFEFNTFLGWVGFDGKQPIWMSAKPRGDIPGIKLNVADRYHRKNFYFLKAYYRQACREPLGQFLKQTLTPGGTYLEIGAHIGFYAFLASKLVGSEGRVYAFEPDPMTLESLEGSVELNGGHVRVVAAALSDHEGELVLYRAGQQAHSLVPVVDGDPRYRGESSTVKVTKLDTWAAAEHGFDPTRIQAIKIDVEGHEAETVAGALDTLRRAKLPPIWCEVRGPEGSTRAPNTFAKVHALLTPLGYVAHRFNGGNPQTVTVEDVKMREDVLFRTPTR